MRLDHITPKNFGHGRDNDDPERLINQTEHGAPPCGVVPNSLPGGNRVLEPPDPIPNSEVKQYIADGSVGVPM